MRPLFSLTIEQSKASFFDRVKIENAEQRARVKALSRVGAFLRRRARSSIRRRNAVSQAGQPPSSHTDLLRQFLFFAYDRATGSLVVGPAKLNRPGDAPEVLEFGGEVLRQVEDKQGRMRQVLMHYRPRPYMKPALDAELAAGTIPEQWAGVIGG